MSSTDAVKLLTDDEVAEIEAHLKRLAAPGEPWESKTEKADTFQNVAARNALALCQTVRALRELLNDASETDSRCRELLKTYDRSSPDGIIPLDEVVEAMQSDVNTTLREPYAALIEHQGVLVDENTALREQLAQAENEREILRTDLKYRYEVIEELRRCRDRWLTMLNPPTGYESVDDAIRLLQSQLAQVTQERNALRDSMSLVAFQAHQIDGHVAESLTNQAATQMRDKCVERVKAMRDEWNRTRNIGPVRDTAKKSGWIVAANQIIPVLESLTLDRVQEQP